VLRVDVAREARGDLEEVLRTSFERWGEAGRARYQALLEAAVDQLVADPERVISLDRRDLAPGLRSVHLRHVGGGHGVKQPVHIIYYRKARASLVIVRVLHERMEASSHLRTVAARRRPPPDK